MRTPYYIIALALAATAGFGATAFAQAHRGHNVSSRCSLTDTVALSPWEPLRELKVLPGKPASAERTIFSKRFPSPADLSPTPLIQYRLLAAPGPGRDFTARLTLRSPKGGTFVTDAHVIPTLWQTVICDVGECPFLSEVSAIEISLVNHSPEPWADPTVRVTGLIAGRPLDLDFAVPGSADRVIPVGAATVTPMKGAVRIKFGRGAAADIATAGSRNNLYSPSLDKRNTVDICLSNRGPAGALRLYVATDSCPQFTGALSKTLPVKAGEGMQRLSFNFADLPAAKGRISALRLLPEGGDADLIIDRISFEREAKPHENAGRVTACTATPEAVSVTGTISNDYAAKGGRVEVRLAPLYRDDAPFDSLELLGSCPAQKQFTISDIPNSRLDGRLTHLSSRFKAALRCADGSLIPVGSPFFIENWEEFIANPYEFQTNNADFRVVDFGARGDGVTNDNAAIQRAIDAAGACGGGRVILQGNKEGAPRQYLATNLELLSGVNLVIEPGAVLRQSPDFSHYPSRYQPEWGHDNVIPNVPWTHCMYTNRPLILAKDVNNVKINGGGVIRLDDTYSENPLWGHYAKVCSDRIHVVPIAICNTSHVEIKDLDITHCSNYHTIFYRAYSVFIGNLKMHDVSCLSGDGLSFGNAVTNVRVAHCFFESNDDGIVLCSSYKDPRGGVWRERVDTIDASVRNIEVTGSYINGAHGGGGNAIALIPWGSTNPRQDHNEIDNIRVTDCVLRGGTSVGSWPDNPFDGKPFTNAEPDDYAPVKNLHILNNEYLSPVRLNGVVPTTLITDCGLHGSTTLKNCDFRDRLAYWSHSGNVTAETPHSVSLSGGHLWQGLWLEPGNYTFTYSQSGENQLTPEIQSEEAGALSDVSDGSFTVTRPATVSVGVTGTGSITAAQLIKQP